ncbi:MAG: NAD(P) transhydrogenase subunit alpha [Acidimicrobiales bacterium]|nr:NAD(P) transhydrogenase subunit alpha [Acidimicrobiales bacterium]
MHVTVVKETAERERRVALTPVGVEKLTAAGHTVTAETGCGRSAGFTDEAYSAAGATVTDRDAALASGGVVVGIHAVRTGIGPDHVVVGLVDPIWRPAAADRLAETGATVLSLELMPRITRAQSMDVLSSMATVAGYEAVLLAATRLPKMFPLLMTAAGTVPAARTVVLGAGVAGLQAIATARRLGSVVEAYDVRPAAAEQIESVGGKSIRLDLDTAESEDVGGYARAQSDDTNLRQQELLAPYIADADIVITTAAIPGARSPELVTTAMVDPMRPGSVIVDLAAERGGNCSLTRADDEVVHNGVTVLGPTDLASRSATSASRMYSNNVVTYLTHLTGDNGELVLDVDDEITAGTLVARGGSVVHPNVIDAIARSNRGSE